MTALAENPLAALRAALPQMAPDHIGHDDYAAYPEMRAPGQGAPIPAAVLIPVIARAPEPTLLFTRRTEHLARHSGQISFPGGRSEAGDLSPVETALRETREETGIDPGFVTIAGYLPRYLTGTGFDIRPVVGVVTPGFALAPDVREVAEIFEVPLAFFLDSANARDASREMAGKTRRLHVFEPDGHYIWGITAALLFDLAALLGAAHGNKNLMKIDPAKHSWLTEPDTSAVMGALGHARFVGGTVRNALLGAGVTDIDIAVPVPPEETMRLLQAANIKAIPTGLDHGTITAIHNGKVFEITSLRRDVATDGRHAVVAYTREWDEDAARRDFTINALYAAPDGEIFDYNGGLQDLVAGRVRFVGEARARIAEDYLRILRLFRFHAWYGKGEIDAEALRAVSEAKAGLKKLSGERIAKELLRLLECPNPGPVLRLMAASGVLPELLPYALSLPRLERLTLVDADNFFPADALLRLAALLPNDVAIARAVAERLRLSTAEREWLEELAGAGALEHLSARDAHKLLYKIGAPAFKDRVRLSWAGGDANALAWRMLLTVADSWRKPHFPFSGRDVLDAGVPEGPAVGKILAEVENWWIENDFQGDEPLLAEKLKTAIQAHSK